MGEPRLLVEALYSYSGDREDRLTEVLASVLQANGEFANRLAARLGLQSQPVSFDVETQFGPIGQRRLVDLVLRGRDAQGALVATIFVENKYNPMAKLDPYWFDESQAERQGKALTVQPGEKILAAIASEKDLARLDGPVELRPPFDPRIVYSPVISWSHVRAVAQKLAGASGGKKSWSPTSLASDRLLQEFVAYLDLEGDSMGAIDKDDLFVLSRLALTEDRIDRLLDRATRQLGTSLNQGDAIDDVQFEPKEGDGLDDGFQYEADPPGGTWLEDSRSPVVVVGVDIAAEEGSDSGLRVYAGVDWIAGREAKKHIVGSEWIMRVHRLKLIDEWTKKDEVFVGSYRPLREIVDGGQTIDQQAAILAGWAQERLETVFQLPAPPDVDHESESGAAV